MRKIHAHLLIAALALTTLGGVLASGARKEALETKAAAEEVLYTHTWASGDFDTTKYWSVDGGKFGANAVSSIEGDGVTFQANQYLWRFKYNNSERKRVDNIYIPMRIYGTVTVQVQDESCAGGQSLWEFLANNGDTAINIKHAGITGSLIEIYLNWDYGNKVAATCRFIYGETVKFATALTNTVTFNKNGGSGGSSSATASQGEAMPSISVPSRTGYTFLGYFDSSTGGTKYYNANGTSARNWDKGNDTTLYAQWSANTYNISYSANAPSNRSHQVANMPDNQTVTYDTNATLGSAPTLTGWSFLGWYNNSSLTTKIGNAGQTLTKPNLAASGTVTLNAYWQANTYTVKYDANKPTNATSSVSNLPNDSTWTYDATCTLPSQTPTLEGWTFDGWYKEASCTN
ncbi:MAG: InlB B-repeat-containing protein, partial [Bacilli bacterium]|nr:InlB B-repeat-containing protein [Bacilli bacterium]